MALVLREHGNRPLSAREIADEINQRRLYAKRDGSDAEVSQIHARAKNYANQFAKVGSSSASMSRPLGDQARAE